jgi:hypothetical protein
VGHLWLSDLARNGSLLRFLPRQVVDVLLEFLRPRLLPPRVSEAAP